ncbi:hypothetical protein H310_06162 [Aphanomyces invadans]|uniref:Uncharacterized protein n=1 Tax=Aphanomyces invadans TaxID=157072 RepID=A0A024U5G0_9STRA|nr:hypothetical protein H310_06162 [Aphanomyces invadans]ETW01489.1 hypothetical protein H310_06162 [Aphanomyces invadans]|eukprot:XP_008869337.1 hypothetical protein H310_06162 [Aphanomyces invadans]
MDRAERAHVEGDGFAVVVGHLDKLVPEITHNRGRVKHELPPERILRHVAPPRSVYRVIEAQHDDQVDDERDQLPGVRANEPAFKEIHREAVKDVVAGIDGRVVGVDKVGKLVALEEKDGRKVDACDAAKVEKPHDVVRPGVAGRADQARPSLEHLEDKTIEPQHANVDGPQAQDDKAVVRAFVPPVQAPGKHRARRFIEQHRDQVQSHEHVAVERHERQAERVAGVPIQRRGHHVPELFVPCRERRPVRPPHCLAARRERHGQVHDARKSHPQG